MSVEKANKWQNPKGSLPWGSLPSDMDENDRWFAANGISVMESLFLLAPLRIFLCMFVKASRLHHFFAFLFSVFDHSSFTT